MKEQNEDIARANASIPKQDDSLSGVNEDQALQQLEVHLSQFLNTKQVKRVRVTQQFS